MDRKLFLLQRRTFRRINICLATRSFWERSLVLRATFALLFRALEAVSFPRTNQTAVLFRLFLNCIVENHSSILNTPNTSSIVHKKKMQNSTQYFQKKRKFVAAVDGIKTCHKNSQKLWETFIFKLRYLWIPKL